MVNLNKPPGATSRTVVDRVVRLAPGVKAGHAGTLDPLATGVLVVCIGAATRLIEFVQRMPKTYRTMVRLGARSDTLDAAGEVTEIAGALPPSELEIRGVLETQVGVIAQRPPEYSALKVKGQRAYDLARIGVPVNLAPRTVTIRRIELLGYDWPRLELEIECGSGTYIRAIARDVGTALGCGGLVEALTRTRIGPFTLAEAIDPERLAAATVAEWLRPATEAVSALPRLQLSAAHLAAVVHGRPLIASEVAPGGVASGEIALIGPDGALAAVAEHVAEAGRIFPRRVLASG
jgi:tRNA pseudouridine55 synthase